MGNSKPENERLLLEPSWSDEGQEKQRIGDRVFCSRERYAGHESEAKSLTCQSTEEAGS